MRLTGDASQQAQPRPAARVWAGQAIFVWSIGYMLPHLYWALGGTAGLALVRPEAAALPEWRLINWVASVFLTAAGGLGLALAYLPRRPWLSGLLLAMAWAGCSLAASHGLDGLVNRLLQFAGLATVEGAPFGLPEHAYVVWDLLLFEPWFLIEGLLLGLAGWCYLRQPRHRRVWLALCALGVGVGLVTAVLGVRVG